MSPDRKYYRLAPHKNLVYAIMVSMVRPKRRQQMVLTKVEYSMSLNCDILLTDEAQRALEKLMRSRKNTSVAELVSEAIVALHRREVPAELFQGKSACGMRVV
jgi:hypothetical protein